MENPASLLRRLNPYCARAMEGAASLCQTRAHAEILPEHWLLKLLEQGEGDLTVLARRYEWDMDAIWQDLLGWLDTLPRSVRSRPQLSDSIETLMQQAWLFASLNGEEHIRSVHLLMALVDKPKLARCDGLWPLLTLGQSQLERLRPLLDAQSDERPDVQQEAELAQNHGGEVEFVGRPVGADIKEGELNPALQNALDKFTLDVTARAKEGKIDPVFGRDTEIRQMVDILSRRRKNNPILVGEPGVGKTALVEGLALRIADGDVCALLAGRGDQSEREQVGDHGHHGAAIFCRCNDARLVDNRAGVTGLLQHDAVDVALGQALREICHLNLEPESARATPDHGDGLREEVCIEHGAAVRHCAVGSAHQQHRLGCRRALVEHRGVGDGQTGEVTHHGLKVEQRLEAALRNLWLVRRVGRVPRWRLEHVAANHGRRVGAVEPLADHLSLDRVLVGKRAQVGENLLLAAGGRQIERCLAQNVGRHCGVHECFKALVAQRLQHVLAVCVRSDADVTVFE